MTNASVAIPTDAERSEVILKALQRSREPLTASKLRGSLTGPYRLRADELTELLNALVKEGKAYCFAPYRSKLPRFWDRDCEEYARQEISLALEKYPLTISRLQITVQRRLSDCNGDRRKQILLDLVRTREIYELPKKPGTQAVRYSKCPPDPKEYVTLHIERIRKVAEQLATVGVPTHKTLAAARDMLSGEVFGDSIDELILQRLVDLEPGARQGALVSVKELRNSLDFPVPNKQTFDTAVLQLSRDGKIALHRHDFPASLSCDERDQLVTDNDGNFYIGIALRT